MSASTSIPSPSPRSDLWGEAANPRDDVTLDLWESYLVAGLTTRSPPAIPVFEEPWQAQVLAMADSLVQAGRISAKDWAEALGAELARAEAAGAPDTSATYYEAALTALEHLTTAGTPITAEDLATRKAEWTRAYKATPHGQPVTLASAAERANRRKLTLSSWSKYLGGSGGLAPRKGWAGGPTHPKSLRRPHPLPRPARLSMWVGTRLHEGSDGFVSIRLSYGWRLQDLSRRQEML